MDILNQKISYYEKIFDAGSQKTITIKEVLLKIKSSVELKSLIEKIRTIEDKKERQKIKKQLPAVTFSGLFSYRKKEHLVESSGVAVIDLDIKKINDIEKIKEIKAEIKKFPFVLFIFQSPSGGLKVGCRIPKVNSDKEYKMYYLALSQEFTKFSEYLDNDSNTKDIDRLCYLSYDPDLYLNEFCIEYTHKVEEDKVNDFESLYHYNVFVDAKRIEEILRDKSVYKLIIADPEEMAKFDNDRSRAEQSLITKLYMYGIKNFEQIDYIMTNYSQIGKWQEKPLSYKELTYNKAIHFYSENKEEILKLLLDKKKNDVIEMLTNDILHLNNIYTIRDDDKTEMWIYMEGIYIPNGKTYVEQYIEEILGKYYDRNLVNKVIDKIRTKTFISSEDFFVDKYPFEIPVLNGILNIKTRTLSEFTPKKIFFAKLPVTYNPEAKPNAVLKFIEDIVEHPEDIKLIQEYFGYLLYKRYPFEKALMLKGSGRNGKSQFLELIKRFLGRNNYSSLSLQRLSDEKSFNIHYLFGKLANLGGDISSEYIENTSMFKQLTGGDTIQAQRKFKNDIMFENYAKLIFACNELPQIKDKSDGFWDRWFLIKFPYKFVYPEEYKKATAEEQKWLKFRKVAIIESITTEEELSGLLNWALDGLDRLLQNKRFSITPATLEVNSRWQKEADSFAAFYSEMLESADENTFVKASELKIEYQKYCIKNKLPKAKMQHIRNYLEKETPAYRIRSNKYPSEKPVVYLGIKFKFGYIDEMGLSTLDKEKINELEKRAEKELDDLYNLK